VSTIAPDLLRRLAAETAGVVGDSFALVLVRHVARAFGADAACIVEDPAHAGDAPRLVALWPGGAGVAAQDGDAVLTIELPGADHASVGRLIVRSTRPLDPDPDELAVLDIFAARAAAELERRRHQAALRAREAEVAAARSRVLDAADGERRRIGRDLHDGAQQRIVALGHLIGLARRQLGDDAPPAAVALLERAHEEARLATDELRELARGLHPAGLTEKGLGPALEALAARAPVPVVLEALPERRLPGPVELTAYYLASEALTNAVKYAEASTVRIAVHQHPATAVLTVADDGIGGAQVGEAATGSGLRGLRDRVAALGGRFEVESPPGAGTRLTATIPLAPWRSAHEPFLEFGHPGDGGRGEASIQAVISGARSVSVTLAREWELEGGVPRIGQLLPVMDHAGRRRATVEIVRVASLAFDDIDEDVIAPRLLNAETLDDWRARQLAFYEECRDELALLFGEPGWRFCRDEPMVLTWYRPVAGGADDND
jgi:signal transduction histidine kinase/uncharacterized protein YhfF